MNTVVSSLSKNWKSREFRGFWLGFVFVVALAIAASVGVSSVFLPLTVGLALGCVAVLFLFANKLIRINSEIALRSREFSTLIENLKDGIIVYDPSFTIISINVTAERMVGVTTTDVVGKKIGPGSVNDARLKTFTQVMFPSIAPSVNQLSEMDAWPQVVSISIDEPRLDLLSTLHRILDSRGELLGFLKILGDQTHEKSMIEGKDEFISVAAHQLRTPLTAIGWASENLMKLSGDASPEMSELIKQISQLSQRTLRLTNDLLDAAKIEEGRFGYVFEDVDLVGLVKGVLKDAAIVAREYAVQVYIDLPEQGPLVVSMDPSRISTVLSNLLDNAIKYNTKNGKVTVVIKPVEQQPFVRVTISDTGIGVPADETGKLFKKLERASNAATTEPNGTGLGLYIARNIIKRHGGEMGFESSLGRGSSFWFTLPTDPSLIPQKETSYSG